MANQTRAIFDPPSLPEVRVGVGVDLGLGLGFGIF